MEKPLKQALWWIVGGFMVALVIAGVTSKNEPGPAAAQAAPTTKAAPVYAKVGDPVRGQYFETTIDSVATSDRIDTRNQYTQRKAKPGESFLILGVTLRNIDTQARLAFDGELYLVTEKQEYKYQRSETILADGWGLLLDNINPMLSKSTRIVYVIPANVVADMYYKPHGADKQVFLGRLEPQ